jgi:hypothetical protein
MELTTVAPKVYLLTFDTQKDVTSTFLRFQEYYESPEFAGKVFTLDEYKEWYVKNSPNGIKTGEFTYYSDWSGFNIPSTILQPFYEGKFHPLSEAEQRILDLFRDKEHPFYIIGVHKESKSFEKLLRHETAHGLFFTNPEYKKEALDIISKYDTTEVRKDLLASGGYGENVLDDEVHAYSISGGKSLGTNIPEALCVEMNELFEKYTRV